MAVKLLKKRQKIRNLLKTESETKRHQVEEDDSDDDVGDNGMKESGRGGKGIPKIKCLIPFTIVLFIHFRLEEKCQCQSSAK